MTKEMFNNEIENFRDKKVWITKKARMIAESRMIKNNDLAMKIINWYTFLTLAGSILCLSIKFSNEFTTYYIVIVSVGLFGFSNYLSSKNYLEKAFRYRETYFELSKLEDQLTDLLNSTDNNKRNELLKLKLNYEYIVALSDNHDEIDFKRINIDSNKMYYKDIFIYNIYFYSKWAIFFIAPIIIFILGVFLWK
ncbi:SLATT domain-containing protein [Clostridium perfringens]|uniref:SLATT domain-containing protein n=1 Tax=Clostridium perfringens TaxID=1502 RepID=UPI000D99C77B|nr:SLATT domain-containing protein [Clostridium perfringens]EJT6498163.1 SLATT domain-containing protein [Clostridium perfringens]ELC8466258.1 SLATT domain-containing protein [Clostridium perfringens]MDG6887109.1 hypothetical protein [Clostridium perfringens]MDK0721681.1 SLATT domain-containing protein [Clostridium perfringens]MDK0769167.1 SLATT domain-containing protein [Clostridium perfringens]